MSTIYTYYLRTSKKADKIGFWDHIKFAIKKFENRKWGSNCKYFIVLSTCNQTLYVNKRVF